MQPINDQTNIALHKKLPIDADEKVLAIYRHHWFAYAYSWIVTVLVVVGMVALAWFLTTSDSSAQQYRAPILAGVGMFALIVLIGGFIPAYLRSQEQLVLTEESLLKLLKPTIFSHKVDQLGLQHVADVSVNQDFIGTMFGFGTITIETPGEQRTNYDFIVVANPTSVAQQISEAKENFDAALQGGRLQTSLGQPATPQIDPQQYQEFLAYQKMVQMQQGQNGTQPVADADSSQNNNSQPQPPQPQQPA